MDSVEVLYMEQSQDHGHTWTLEKKVNLLSTYVFGAAKLGYGKTRQQIKGIAENVAKEKDVLQSQYISDATSLAAPLTKGVDNGGASGALAPPHFLRTWNS